MSSCLIAILAFGVGVIVGAVIDEFSIANDQNPPPPCRSCKYRRAAR